MGEHCILVSGGSSGLGAAVVAAAAKRGWDTVIVDRKRPDGEPSVFVSVDLEDTGAAEQMVRSTCEHHPVDAVVTAAGIDACGRFEDVHADAWERVVAVNLLGTAAVIRGAYSALAERQGRVVTVASTLGLRPLPDATAYCASKFGVVGFSRALAAESAGSVGVTCLIPGGMATSFFDGRDPKYQPPADAQLNPPEVVADAVLFALDQPWGSEIREMVVCPSHETSWP